MLKRILVLLDNSKSLDSILSISCKLAKKQNCELTALFIIDHTSIEKNIGPGAVGASHYQNNLYKTLVETAQKTLDRLEKIFVDECKKEKINYKIIQKEGSMADVISRISSFYDLVICGPMITYHYSDSEVSTVLIHKFSDNIITPILLVPEDTDKKTKLRISILFDGNIQSLKALRQFIDFKLFSNLYSSINLVCGAEEEKEIIEKLEEAKKFLQSKGLSNVITKVTNENFCKYVEEKVLPASDLVVLGMHKKKNAFDFSFASLSKYIMGLESHMLFLGN